MADYMSGYGVEDERRSEIRRKIALTLVAVLGALFIWWMFFRNFSEERRLNEFVEALKARNYQKGYAMFGCTSRTPCTDYAYPKFLEDWGPEGRFKNAGQGVILRSGHTGGAARRFLLRFKPPDDCPGSIIRVLRFDDTELNLMVNREDGAVGFSPWPVCSPRLKF